MASCHGEAVCHAVEAEKPAKTVDGKGLSRARLALCLQDGGTVQQKSVLNAARSRGYRVLVGDSDVAFAAHFAAVLQARGCFVVRVCNGHDMQVEIERSLEIGCAADAFDLVVCEARLSGKTGLEVCAELRGRRASPPFVFLAAPRDRFAHAQARRLRALGIVAKPVDIEGLSVFVRGALV